MLELTSLWNYFWMLTTAVVAGAIGGVGFELMQTRSSGRTGAVQTPHRLSNSPYFDLGVLSSILLGAITAVAVLYFFPPETRITVQALSGSIQTGMSYDVVKLIAFSLLVGSAGPSFLSAIQARVAVALNEQKAANVRSQALEKYEQLGQATKADLEDIQSTLWLKIRDVLDKLPEVIDLKLMQAMTVESTNGHQLAALEADQAHVAAEISKHLDDTIENLHSICNDAEATLQDRLQKRVDAAKKTLSAAASSQPES